MHLERERALLQPRHGRHRTLRKTIKQRPNFPVVENAPLIALLIARENVKGLHIAWRDQLQYPRLRGSKTGRDARKLFEEVRSALLEPRKQAQIRLEKIEPGLRRR